MTTLVGLAPVIDERAQVLILGSFPSTASLAAGQYYAHRQNQFWRILGELLGQPLAAMGYAEKQHAVKAARLAIWDVYGQCERAGSLDAAIRQAVPNDFRRLKKLAPQLRRVCFNGQTPGKFAADPLLADYVTVVLPSTSPAHAGMGFADKLARWRAGVMLSRASS